MTLFDVLAAIKIYFPNVNRKDVCRITNELEERIVNEIFSPYGITSSRTVLNESTDMNTPLLLEEEYLSLYIYFVCAILSVRELDFESSNSYSILFNEKFKELAVFYRRNNLPIKNTALKGGF